MMNRYESFVCFWLTANRVVMRDDEQFGQQDAQLETSGG